MHKPKNFTTSGQWLDWMEQLHPTEIDMGLSRIKTVYHRLNISKPKAIVSISGTNGKGSTAALISQLFAQQGFSRGVYSSPHLNQYHERIQIDGKFVDEALLCQTFAALDEARGDISLTYFEFATLAAIWVFDHLKLDVWVMEVGLGGRLDAVNILDADCAVITSIGLDHIDWLGDDLEIIRQEKSGIARPGKPLILGRGVYSAALAQFLKANDLAWVAIDDQILQHEQNDRWSMQGLGMDYQKLPTFTLPTSNAVCAITAVKQLALAPLSQQQIVAALKNWQIPGRMTHVSLNGHQLTLDVAHNPQAAQYLADQFQAGFDRCVLGMLKDKDVQEVVQILSPRVEQFSLIDLNVPRGLKALEIKSQANIERVNTEHTLEEILNDLAFNLNNEKLNVLICGSFFTVAQAFSWLEKHTN